MIVLELNGLQNDLRSRIVSKKTELVTFQGKNVRCREIGEIVGLLMAFQAIDEKIHNLTRG